MWVRLCLIARRAGVLSMLPAVEAARHQHRLPLECQPNRLRLVCGEEPRCTTAFQSQGGRIEPGPHDAVTDDSLVQCLRDVRRALGPLAGRYLRTERGRGYIFESAETGWRLAYTSPAVRLTQIPFTPASPPQAVAARAQGWTGRAAALPSVTPSSSGAPRPPIARRTTVGRDVEKALLETLLQEARSGPTRMVLVTGEPGVGKTTLVEDFLASISGQGRTCRIGRGRCSQQFAGTSAYSPMLEAVRELMESGGMAASCAVRALAPTWSLGIAGAGKRHAPPGPAPAPEQLKRELAAVVEELARQQPLVLFLDDLHWADAATLDLIGYLLEQPIAPGALLVGTYHQREPEVSGAFVNVPLDLKIRGLCRELEVGPLGRTELEQYIALTFPSNALPAQFGAVVHHRTAGHPLFMVELLRYLAGREVLIEQNGSWTMLESLETVEKIVPQSVQSMVTRTLEGLTEDARHVLVAAAVQGGEFDLATVSAALDTDPADIEEQLARLHGIVTIVGEVVLPDGTLTARYRFAHALYPNELYGSLRPARRARLSLAVAAALGRFHAPRLERVAGQLAPLFAAARDFERATEQFLVASSTALDRSGPVEAATLARRGLELVHQLSVGYARDRRELALRRALGAAINSSPSTARAR